jgi:transcriptional regulator with XRE-family HTH domain
MIFERDSILTFLKSEMEQNKYSFADLERKAGVSKDTLRDFFRGKSQLLRVDKLQKILKTLGYDWILIKR